MNAASRAHVARTLSRSLSSPTDNDLFALREGVCQIVAPSLVRLNRFGCVTGLQMALETWMTPPTIGQSTSATIAKKRGCLVSKGAVFPNPSCDIPSKQPHTIHPTPVIVISRPLLGRGGDRVSSTQTR